MCEKRRTTRRMRLHRPTDCSSLDFSSTLPPPLGPATLLASPLAPWHALCTFAFLLLAQLCALRLLPANLGCLVLVHCLARQDLTCGLEIELSLLLSTDRGAQLLPLRLQVCGLIRGHPVELPPGSRRTLSPF